MQRNVRRESARRLPAPCLGRGSDPPAVNERVRGSRALVGLVARKSTQHDRDNLVRFGITASKAFGVSMANIQVLAKRLGRNHELAAALWETGWYEARMLTSFVDEPARVTPAQMDRWCRDFDNWGICDTCASTSSTARRTPGPRSRSGATSARSSSSARPSRCWRASPLHDKTAADEPFLEGLPLIERAATDERNFVKKGVNWALRSVGRRNAALHAAAVDGGPASGGSPDAAARWVGKDALKDLDRPSR